MNELEKLYIVIEAQTSQVKSEVAKVNKQFEGMNKTINKAQSGINKAFASIAKAAVAAFSIVAIARYGKSLLDLEERLDTLSKQTGISMGRIQELEFAMSQSGGSVDSLKRGIQTLNEQIAAGNPAFKQLGINTSNAEVAFNQVLDALADMPESAEKAALGNQLLGRSYIELRPLLAEGSEKIAELSNSARESGFVMSDSLLSAIGKLGDSLALLKTAFISAFYPIVNFVIPAIQALIEKLTYAVGFITGIIRAIFVMEDTITGTGQKANTIATGFDDAAKSAKKLKGQLAGFDELNVIADPATTTEDVPSVSSGVAIGESAAKALLDAQKATAKFNEAVQKGINFWDKWKEEIITVISLIGFAFAVNELLKFSGVIGAVMGYISAAYADAYLVLTQGATASSWLSATFAYLQGTLAGMLGTIAAVVALVIAVGAAIWQLWNETSERGNTFRENITSAFNGLIETILLWWSYIEPIFLGLWKILEMVWENGVKPLWDGFVEAVGGIINVLMVLWTYWLKPLVDFFIKIFGPIVQGVILGIAAVFGGLLIVALQMVGGILKALGTMWTWMSTVLKGGWTGLFKLLGNAFIGLVNLVINGINTMIAAFLSPINALISGWNATVGKLAGKIPELKVSIKAIPYLANGGVLNAGQLFVAGEAGAEMVGSHNGKTTVMPLENTDFTAAMGQAVYSAMVEAMSAQGSNSITLTIDGMVLAKATETNLNKLSTIQGGLKIAL